MHITRGFLTFYSCFIIIPWFITWFIICPLFVVCEALELFLCVAVARFQRVRVGVVSKYQTEK